LNGKRGERKGGEKEARGNKWESSREGVKFHGGGGWGSKNGAILPLQTKRGNGKKKGEVANRENRKT